MKQIIWLLVSFLMFVPRVKASITVNTDVLKKSVVFIYAVTPEGEADVHKPLGSGFLVGIPGKADPSRGTAILVTARHIVDPEWDALFWRTSQSCLCESEQKEVRSDKGCNWRWISAHHSHAQ